MEKMKILVPLAAFFAGVMLLLIYSSIEDIGIAIISIGGLFSIWFKLGKLESETKQLGNRLEVIERYYERAIDCALKRRRRKDDVDNDY